MQKRYSRENENILSSENSKVLNSLDSHMFHLFQNIITENMVIRIIAYIMLISLQIRMVQGLDMRHQNSVMSISNLQKERESIFPEQSMKQENILQRFLIMKGLIISTLRIQRREPTKSILNV